MALERITFGTTPDGREVSLYQLKNGNGMTAVVTPYGCRVVELWTKDRTGKMGDVVLGHCTLEEYLGANFQGSFVGRYANRIGKAQFTLDGKTYRLAKNDGENTLHGGPGGYHQVLWDVDRTEDGDEPSIVFSHTSPDGDEGYPGTLTMKVTYRLTAQDELVMEYRGESDAKTPFNPTNHSFFNLSGDCQNTVLDTRLQLFASQYTTVAEDLIPDGKLASVAGGPLDFTTAKPLGQDMFDKDPLIQLCQGFDHNFCVDGTGFRKVAHAYEPETGRVMEVFSDMPGVQLYTFNKGSNALGKDENPMPAHTAFCLETQFYPDSVNHPEFPFTFCAPGEPFYSKTVYRFSAE